MRGRAANDPPGPADNRGLLIQIGPVHIAGNMSRVLAGVPGPWFGPSSGRGATDHELIPGRKHRFAGPAGIDAAGPPHQPPMSSGSMRKVTVNRRKWRIAGQREYGPAGRDPAVRGHRGTPGDTPGPVLLRAPAAVGLVDIRWSGGRRSGGLRHPDANRTCGRGGGKA